MEISRAKLALIVVGSAAAGVVVFVLCVGFVLPLLLPSGVTLSIPAETRVASAPASEPARFLGAHARSGGVEIPRDTRVLDAGPGRLVGTVTLNGKPLEGLRLRLFLDSGIFTQWATSDSGGRYAVAVPLAVYRIVGYAVDPAVADRVLKGKIDSPLNVVWGTPIGVTASEPGSAPSLDFVDPVKKIAPFGEVSAASPIVIEWSAYPNAKSYRVQMFEQSEPTGFREQKELFDFNSQPRVTATRFNPADAGVDLKKGKYYSTSIEAMDESERTISHTPRAWEADFVVAR